ncbi:MAG: hypothetical protein JXP34_26750 [Planctomycetes bacterium]|nr:hypothetical protein [Planctomycetota bacterium]
MSLYDYRISREISKHDPPFAALIMAAMRKADSRNVELLRAAWPAIWQELYERYHAPGGLLPGEEKGEKARGALAHPATPCGGVGGGIR